MSDTDNSDNASKQHEPTQQKLRKSREKGDVPYSTEATAAATYGAFFLIISASGAWFVASIFKAVAPLLSEPDRISDAIFSQPAATSLGPIIAAVGLPLGVFLFSVIVAIALSVVAQGSFAFSLSKLKPKLSKLSIVENAKQKYGPNGISEFVKRVVKLCAVLGIVLFAAKGRFVELTGLIGLPANALILRLQSEAVLFVGLTTAAAVVIAAADLPWKHHQHRQRLRMTHEELKQENKEMEGDPGMKGARRRRSEEIARNRMLADVPKADIVIVNPTHYAVALQWNRHDGTAPVCIAKGVDEIAMRIREAASVHGVPIRRDPPTARSIFALVEIGDQIKREHYAAVAAAIHYADQIRKKKPVLE